VALRDRRERVPRPEAARPPRDDRPARGGGRPAASGEGADARLESRQRRAAVRQALASLSDEQREALVLARYHGLPYAEISKVLGISVGAVKTRIFRAVEILKARFSEGERSWNAVN